MGIFDGFNQFSKRNAEGELPSVEDKLFLEDVCEYTKLFQITDIVSLKFEQIGDGIDAVIDYNSNIDTNDETDYRLVRFDEGILNLYQKAKDNIICLYVPLETLNYFVILDCIETYLP